MYKGTAVDAPGSFHRDGNRQPNSAHISFDSFSVFLKWTPDEHLVGLTAEADGRLQMQLSEYKSIQVVQN